MANYFYLDSNNNPTGPLSIPELMSRGITPATLIWRQGYPDWHKAAEEPELAPFFQAQCTPTPPPPPSPAPSPTHPYSPSPAVSQQAPVSQPAAPYMGNAAADSALLRKRKKNATVFGILFFIPFLVFLYSLISMATVNSGSYETTFLGDTVYCTYADSDAAPWFEAKSMYDIFPASESSLVSKVIFQIAIAMTLPSLLLSVILAVIWIVMICRYSSLQKEMRRAGTQPYR